MNSENGKTKVIQLGDELKKAMEQAEEDVSVDSSTLEDRISEALKHIPAPAEDEDVIVVTEVSLDDIVEELPSEEAEAQDVIQHTSEFRPVKRDNPVLAFFKRVHYRINDEELDEESARATVRVIGIVICLIILITGLLIGVIARNRFASYNTKFANAQNYEKDGNIDKAISSFEKAIEYAHKEEDKIEGRMAIAKLYIENESYLNAAYYLEQVVDIQPDHYEAIEQLLFIYEKNNDMNSILSLAKKAEGSKVKQLFSEYLLTQPVFNYKSGTYNESITVEIEAGESENIYYTVDGSEATTGSMLYTGPITLQEGITVFHAMTENHNGLMSENIVVTYEIISEAPKKPEISLNSGTYREQQKIEVTVPDGCRAYYTFDGSIPTLDSTEYKEPVTLPLGNHVFSVILVNQNGLISEVASGVYDLIFSKPVTKNDAVNLVKSGLVANGEIIDLTGAAMESSYGYATFTCDYVISINSTEYYRVDKTYTESGPSASYAVQIDTGAVFSLAFDAYENYELMGF